MGSTDDTAAVALPRKLWEHPDPESTQMWKFMQEVNRKSGRGLKVRNNSVPFFLSPSSWA